MGTGKFTAEGNLLACLPLVYEEYVMRPYLYSICFQAVFTENQFLPKIFKESMWEIVRRIDFLTFCT